MRNVGLPPALSRVIKERRAFLRKLFRYLRFSDRVFEESSRERCLRFTWLALWNTHVLQELEGEDVGGNGGNGTCNVDVPSVALGFLRGCDEINEARFELAMLISLGYVVGETLLIAGIDILGRKPFLSKHSKIVSRHHKSLYYGDA